MASSQKPRMSLPPELSAIDEAWGEEEQTTLPRPSRMPTAPVPPEVPDIVFSAPPPTGIELEAIEEASFQERTTTVPRVPLDEYARRMMASRAAEQAITESPPPGSRDDSELELNLRFSAEPAFPSEERVTAVRHPSQVPTAPPPGGFETERQEIVPNPVQLQEMEFDLASELPPPFSPAHGPRAPGGPRREASLHQTMKDRFAMGDFSGALEVAEQILARTPHDLEARSLSEKCRDVLLDMYSSKISGLDRTPKIVMSPDQIRWLSLDHRAGFMLSMIDGISSVDDLLDVSGMQRLDALRILCTLLDQKVIALH